LLALTLLMPAAASAAEVTVNTNAVRPAVEAPALEMKDNAIQLSLERAVEIALQQNLGLVIERYTRTQQRLGITQSLGIYDLLANATATAEDTKSATLSALVPSASSRQAVNFSFTQLVPTGGAVSVGWDNSRSESNSQFLQASTFYNSGATFSFSQPLLRDFGRLATERGILIARTNSQVSRQEFERQVTATIQQVVDAYWNLVGARQQLVVAQESLSLARDLHERNRIQVEVGTMAPLEIVQSEAAIASREEDIIRATANIGDAEDALRQLLNLPSGELWERTILPTTASETETVPINVNEAIATAYAERPELRTEELRVAQAQLDAEFFRNQLRPTLDLNVDYGFSGVGLNFNRSRGSTFAAGPPGSSSPIRSRTARRGRRAPSPTSTSSDCRRSSTSRRRRSPPRCAAPPARWRRRPSRSTRRASRASSRRRTWTPSASAMRTACPPPSRSPRSRRTSRRRAATR
jgi:outer membrane protein TolC